MVQSWVFFDPSAVDREIESTLWRNQIENPLFYFSPLSKLDQDIATRLSKEDYYGSAGTKFKAKEFNS